MRKPHSTLLLLGPRGHGKTSLAAGLLRATRSAGSRDGPRDERPRVQEVPLLRSASLSVALVATELESTRRRYTVLDPGEPHAARKRLVAGAVAGLAAVDGAVLVVAAGQRCEPEFKDDLRLLLRLGAAGLVVFLDRAAGEDRAYVDLAEHELRGELIAAGVDGDAVPIVHGAIQSLRDGEPSGIEAALTLLDALDRHVVDRVDERPRLVVARIPDRREPDADCRVVRGALAPGDTVEVVGFTPTRIAQLGAVVAAPELADRVRCTLRGVTAEDLRVGQVLAPPGAFAPQTRFEAELWFVAPCARQLDCQLAYFDVVTIGCLARPIRDSAYNYEIELSSAVVLAPGDGFGLIEDGVVIGVGVVVAVRGATRKRRRGAPSPEGLAVAFVDALHRGERPDVTASLLLPPEDVLAATAPGLAADLRDHILSGRILLQLVADGRSVDPKFAHFNYGQSLARTGSVEYVGPCETRRNTVRHLGRGGSQMVHGDFGEGRSGTREYRLTAGVTVAKIRFPIAVTREGAREDMMVELSIAEFDVRRGVWYLFDFACPYAWQTL